MNAMLIYTLKRITLHLGVWSFVIWACLSVGQVIGCSEGAAAGWVTPWHWIHCYCLCHVWRGSWWTCYKSGNDLWVIENINIHSEPLLPTITFLEHVERKNMHANVWKTLSLFPKYHWVLPETLSSQTSLTARPTSAGTLHPQELRVTELCGSRQTD